MRIQTQLLLAFFLLAVLPLGGIVGFSYVNSQRAISRAASAEAAQLSIDMEERMTTARESVRARVGAVPWERVLSSGAMRRQEFGERLAEELGDVAPMLEGLTFIPAPAAPAPPAPPAPVASEIQPPTPIPSDVELPVTGEVDAVAEGANREGGPALAPENSVLLVAPEVDARARIVLWGADGGVEQDLELGEVDPALLEELGLQGLELDEMTGVMALDFESLFKNENGDASILSPSVFQDLPPGERDEAFRAWQDAAKIDFKAIRAEVQRELAEQRRVQREEQTRMVFGDRMLEIRRDGEVIGSLKPQINPDRLLERVFRANAEDIERRGEVPFAIDRESRLYTAQEEDRPRLEQLGVFERAPGESWRSEDWVVATSFDETTGLRLGVARPIGDALRELRASALRNLLFGLALITLAVLGMLPVSRRLSQGVRQVAEGAERIARGDLETRLPVRGRGELAYLARAFNSMVLDVRDHQERLLAGERRRREEEVERQLMQAELDRQGQELDEAREFQLSMLPQRLPDHDDWETAVHIETATEVGGDYYDFRLSRDGTITAVIGDATGHGARAGTMVTVLKSLFSAHSTVECSPSTFLNDAGRTVRRMDLGRMAMAVSVLQLDGTKVVLSNAGMPPLLHHRQRTGEVVEVLVPGMPLGGLASTYREERLEVESGDSLLLYSDGLPEQVGSNGEPVGYEFVREIFRRAADGSPQQVVAALAAEVARLTGGEAPGDDVTFLLLRRR